MEWHAGAANGEVRLDCTCECDAVTVANLPIGSFGPAGEKPPRVFRTERYDMEYFLHHLGRPTYRNLYGDYLHYQAGEERWMVHSRVTHTQSLRSTCPSPHLALI